MVNNGWFWPRTDHGYQFHASCRTCFMDEAENEIHRSVFRRQWWSDGLLICQTAVSKSCKNSANSSYCQQLGHPFLQWFPVVSMWQTSDINSTAFHCGSIARSITLPMEKPATGPATRRPRPSGSNSERFAPSSWSAGPLAADHLASDRWWSQMGPNRSGSQQKPRDRNQKLMVTETRDYHRSTVDLWWSWSWHWPWPLSPSISCQKRLTGPAGLDINDSRLATFERRKKSTWEMERSLWRWASIRKLSFGKKQKNSKPSFCWLIPGVCLPKYVS